MDQGEFFREITLRICGSLDINQALERTFEYIKAHIPADTIGLGYSDLHARNIQVVARCAIPGGRYVWREAASEISLSEPQVGHILEEPENPPSMVTMVNRPDELDEMLRDLFPHLESNSAMFLRLDLHRERMGALLISAAGLDRYTPEHAALLDSVREPFTIAMTNARRYRDLLRTKETLQDDNRALAADMQSAHGMEVVGADFGLREVMEMTRRVSPSAGTVLLLGETGTGKEVIAAAIHLASPRNKGPFISMQCGAIPESLLDSELFGHEKGAFTGASERKRGRFERAHGGTLFLDEIGELTAEAQVKLLRVLQEKKFERIGGTRAIETDTRVIVATHRNLEEMVREGRFREDLFYRLNVFPIHIPPLRARREDIPSLVQYFVKRKARELNLAAVPRVGDDEMTRLAAYDWPGNVRELQNIVERALLLNRSEQLLFPELHSSASPTGGRPAATGQPRTLDQAVTDHIRVVLEQVNWQVAGKGGAAEILDINPGTLRFRMKKLGITRNS